jgi:hypothetical protein
MSQVVIICTLENLVFSPEFLPYSHKNYGKLSKCVALNPSISHASKHSHPSLHRGSYEAPKTTLFYPSQLLNGSAVWGCEYAGAGDGL